MTPTELHRHAMDLFDRACDLPPADREALLAEACAGEPELRRRVDGMLRQDATDGALADAADAGGAAEQLALEMAHIETNDALPNTIGAYSVIRRIGQGGMGIIYEAEQQSPRRRVALKVLRPGVVGREMLKRFQHEAHVLGQLQHPGIAHIHEAGFANLPAGRMPFFVMEYIDGEPLNRYAETHNFDTRQRLELLARVCDAVQHAHQKGIIHRDLKPANVLVVSHDPPTAGATTSSSTTGTASIDAIGQPKVLDFGIARVTDADVQTVTLQTEVGQLVGTLAYMSPEQVEGNSADLDTRCDVYALGVILYELMASRRPHELTGLPVAEAAHRIRDVVPPRLGTIDRRLRGDVETIVAKALEHDRNRRYATAAELAADIRRHLSDQPIDARPASRLYQLNRFAKRNRGLVAGIGATILALAIGLAVSVYGLTRANEATRLAKSESLRVQEEAEKTKQALADVKLVADFQGAVIKGANMQEMGGVILKSIAQQIGDDDTASPVRTALDKINAATVARAVVDGAMLSKASQAAHEQFAERPELEANIHEYLAETYFGIALYDQSLREAKAALDLRREHLGNDNLDTIRMIGDVGHILMTMNRLDEAKTYAAEALQRLRAVLPEDHKLILEARDRLAEILRDQGEVDEATTRAEAIVDDAKRLLPADDHKLLVYQQHLAILYMRAHRYEEGLAISQGLLETAKRRLGEDDRWTLACWTQVAGTLGRLGRLKEAEKEYAEILTRTERTLGKFDPRTLRVLHNVAALRMQLGQNAAAREALVDLLGRQRKALPADDPEIQVTIDALGKLSASQPSTAPSGTVDERAP